MLSIGKGIFNCFYFDLISEENETMNTTPTEKIQQGLLMYKTPYNTTTAPKPSLNKAT